MSFRRETGKLCKTFQTQRPFSVTTLLHINQGMVALKAQQLKFYCNSGSGRGGGGRGGAGGA